ncbi:MAG: hypothetical protein MUE97_01635 [Phycisphaerales bacterium]|jgi:hypothetical protein|nr:hypothetical protein [Phycisphaerales bacterium]
MLKRSSNAILEISPTRLELAVVRGSQVEQVRAERYNPPEPNADWAEVLRARHSTLKTWVVELGLDRAPVTVIFSTSTTCTAIFPCPLSAGSTAADRAARTALGEIAGYAITDHPTDAQTIATDAQPVARPAAGSANAATPQRMQHTLACVEQEHILQLLSQWTTSCGLQVQRLLPIQAAPIAGTILALLAIKPSSDDSAPAAHLWLGEHESFLAVGDARGLRLFRPLGIGAESLVEALQRPIPSRTPGGEPVQIDRAAARSILERFGIPQATDLLDTRLDIVGQSVLPLLSPVLQRAAVEIKQSLRFGLTEKDRSGLTVTLTGPLARAPRLAEVLAQLCAATISADAATPATPSTLANTSSTSGAIAQLARNDRLELTLLPAELQLAQLSGKARRALWAGIAASAALVGLYAGWTYVSLATARGQIDTLTSQAEEARKLDDQRRALLATQHAARAAAVHINDSLGPAPEWASVMHAIAKATPNHTLLRTLDFTEEPNDGFTAKLACTMLAADDPTFALQLKDYIEALAKLPVIASVRMGGTNRASTSDSATPSYTFELTVTLVSVPYALAQPTAFKDAFPTTPTPPAPAQSTAPAQASTPSTTPTPAPVATATAAPTPAPTNPSPTPPPPSTDPTQVAVPTP